MAPVNPSQPKHRFASHTDNEFVEFVRGRVHKTCSALNLAVYKDRPAEIRIEEEARAAIASCFQEAWPDAWSPITVRKDWPVADAIVKGDKALIRIAFSPETSFFQGGQPIEAIEVFVKRPPRNIFQRTLNAIKGKTIHEDLAPVGTPDGLPAPKPQTQSAGTGASGTESVARNRDAERMAAQKPAAKTPQIQKALPPGFKSAALDKNAQKTKPSTLKG